MSASRRTSASFMVAGEDKRVWRSVHGGLGRPVRLRALRAADPRAQQVRDRTDDEHDQVDAGAHRRETKRPIERVGAGIGYPTDRSDGSERERKLDPALAVPEPFAPVRALDRNAHLDRQSRGNERQKEAKGERDTTGELRERRDPCPEDRRPYSHSGNALGPAREAGAAPHSKNLLRSVRRDDETDDYANEPKCEICVDDRCDDHGDASYSSMAYNTFHRSTIPGVHSDTRSYRSSVRLDNVLIAVRDFERSESFYCG